VVNYKHFLCCQEWGILFSIEKGAIKVLPIKKILWPTYFSKSSYGALKTAEDLAPNFSAELVVLHVVPPIPVIPTGGNLEGVFSASYPLEMESQTREALGKVVEQNISGKTKTEALVVHGNVAGEIVNVAKRENVDVILMAAHGTIGWQRFVFGSVAERVIRMAQCPVLSIQFPPEETEE
jgi:nucleotide-binding universal stress UspA family protein